MAAAKKGARRTQAAKKGSAAKKGAAKKATGRQAVAHAARAFQRLENLRVADLRLDKRNPRLPEAALGSDQDELLAQIANSYQAIEVAKSIASHGYFPSEPLIVVVERDKNVVVEGNRRLAALLLLHEPEKADELELDDADEWLAIQPEVELPERVPCVVAESREVVAPIIGYRHISGIEPWEAWARARFIAAFVESEHKSFGEVASLVGESEGTIRAHYRNFRLTQQLEGTFGLDASRVRARFGVLTRAMQDQRIRAFMGAPDAADVEADQDPLPANGGQKVRQFVSWVFGDDTRTPLFTDSRKLVELGVVLGSSEATDELRRTNDLEAAFSLAGGVEQRLLARLDRAVSFLEAARGDIGDYRESEAVEERLQRLAELLRALTESGEV